ncbi:MAG: L,D-transpeptidase [Hyphomicrobiaceae bacterium]
MPTLPSIRAALTSLAMAAATVVVAPTANAQDGWLWGGGSSWGSSGRETVRFSPSFSAGQIVVSFGDRRAYFITRPGEAISYPIAIPREQSRWSGVTSVTMKRENPSWTPTPTMLAENPRLPRWVPGGHPMNPLGVRALYLGSSTYRIHGTDAPWTIGSAVSKGCIRMYNKDVLDLYPRVRVGAKVTVTWKTFRGGDYSATGGDEAAPRRTYHNSKRRVPKSAHIRSHVRSAAVD